MSSLLDPAIILWPRLEALPNEEYTHYQFQNKREIRLVYHYPGTGSEIQCTLEAVNLDGKPIFEALSYVWGRSDLSRKIYIDGKWLSVTDNLYAALIMLRPSEGAPRAVWVDAICVNQKDSKERNSQVRLMSKIYNQATRVIAWLGEEAGFNRKSLLQLKSYTAVAASRSGDG